MSQENIQKFEQEVLSKNEQMQAQLKAAQTRESFMQLFVQLGQENGYQFTIQDVEASLQQNQEADSELTDAELETAAGGKADRTLCIFTGPWCFATC